MNCELCGEVIENESIGIYNKHYHFECTHRSKTPPHSFVPNMKIPNLGRPRKIIHDCKNCGHPKFNHRKGKGKRCAAKIWDFSYPWYKRMRGLF